MSTFRRNFLCSALKPPLRDSTHLYRKGKTSVVVGAMERKATTHVGSWLSLSCVPSPAKQVGTSRFRAEAMGNDSAPPAAGAWPDLQHKKRNATAELGRDRPGTETLGPLLKRKIKTAADQAASMLMPPPSSKCLYKHKATRQLGGDLLMNMAETAAPLLKWMQNEADEAAVRTMVPAPSSENLYKHEAMGQLGGDLLMNLDEASVPLLKWIKNDPDEAAVKTMVPPPSSENLLKHKATGQLGGILFSKQTETAKPSLVKRIATAADEASAEAATKLLSAPPSGCLYKLKSKDQPGRNHPRTVPCELRPMINQMCPHEGSFTMHGNGKLMNTYTVYEVYVYKTQAITYLYGHDWRKFAFDYGLKKGDELRIRNSNGQIYLAGFNMIKAADPLMEQERMSQRAPTPAPAPASHSPASAPVPVPAPFTAPAQQAPASALVPLAAPFTAPAQQSPASAPVPLEAPFTAPAQQSPASAPARVPAQAPAPAPARSPRSQLIAVATRVVTRTHLKAMFQAGEIDNLTVKLGQSSLIVLCRFHVGAGITGVAPHYTPSPTTFTWPSSPTDMASSINFNQFLEKEKLKSNGSNFTDWFRHVRIFLNGGNLQYVLDAPLGDPPAETETDEVKNVYATRKTRYSQVQCAILCSLESDLQKRFEHHDPHELIKELKTIFETHAAVECYEASKHFFSCMMEEGSSISEHMLVMTGHAKKLSDLGIVIPNRLGINRVLQSLPPSYKNFVMNYNMQNMNKEFPELFGMLKAAEIEIKKEHQVLMVNKTTSFKKQGKSKGKFKKGGKKAATPPMKPKNGPKPDAECYYCKEKGHWKRNCSKYLADLKSGLVKKKKEGISDIHVIDVYLTSSRSSTWVFDTGSVAHICNSKQELKNKRQLLKDEVTMRVGNGSKVNVIAVGTLPLHLPSGLVLSLNNCYYVPALSMNIISGSCLMQDGYSFKSENNGCSIFMNNIFYGRAPQKNGLFLLDLDSSNTHIHNIDAKRIKLNDNSTYMWHCRLGHIGVKRMKKLHTDGLLESLDFESLDRCEACLMGKMTKTPFSGMMERATDLLEIIHTDVCGPMSVASRGGYRYVLTFTDDLSRYGYIYLMKHKSETFEKFKEFQSEVENQRNKKIKFLRSDRGGEYLSYEFGMHLKKCGILSQLTPPGTPQRNGVSERRNRTLLDMVRSMMSLTDLPLSFWSYALETAAFTLNRAPSKSVETTPYELWFNKKPKLSFLKVWGCEAYVKKLQPDKLEPKAEKCVFIGYPKETIGYTFYHRSEGKIFVAKNGTFLEKEFLTKEVTGRKVELDEIEESLLVDQSSAVPENVPVPPTPTTEEANDNDHETSNETATEPRRSTRDRATPDWYDPCLNVMIVDNNDEDPATYEEAMMSPDSNKWQEAMKSEMGSMYDNKVWTLVDLPDSRKAVENKWIFKRKTDADGNITVYKARLVAKGFRQIQGVDYDETFSPVAKLKSVRILLAIAAFFDYEIWQMDVKTAFLNGDIEEELYMVQPKGFVDPKNADKVCKLQRSIYGLKQASRSWNRRFDKVIKDFGFIQCHGEACIYKKVSGSSVAFLILYVDDILLIGNDIELLSSVKGYLNNSFSMKDLGEASYILGIKIYRDRSRRLIGLSQSTYLDKILKKFRMDESKKGFLPMLPGKVLSKTQGPATAEERERMSQIPYASAVGSIMYAMLCTRPDIAHAVSLTSRYQSDPGMEHWTAVKNILKYLKRTKDMFLCYGGDQELVVTSYTDASWNTDPDDSKSQSGYVFILNGAAVSWASSKQCTVAKSSTESEYIAASEASSEAVWMKRFIVELGVVPSALDPFVIYCDNMGAIANAQEPRSHKRLKHIKLRYHSIREYIEDGEVKICKVHTDLNPLTKALPRAKHDQHQNAMGVRNHQGRWSPHGTPPPWPANPSGGGVPSGLPLRGPATPPME
ncbi:hypothetical protein QYE76_007898, partial [Lolium multiflorum]